MTEARAIFAQDTSTTLSQNHSNIIASGESIDAILDALDISHTDGDITAGNPTTIAPGLLVLIRSPATLQVIFNGTTYDGPDGIVFIPGASNGSYTIVLTGTDTGTYRLMTAQITETANVWEEYTGTITPNETKTYSLSFNASQPTTDPATLTVQQKLDEIDLLVATLGNNSYLTQAKRILLLVRSYASKNRYTQVKTYLENILNQLSLYRRSQTNDTNINTSLTISEKIIDLYVVFLSAQTYLFPESDLTRMATLSTNYKTSATNKLSAAADSGQNITEKSKRFAHGQSYLSEATADNAAGRKAKTRVTFLLSQLLFREAL